MSSHSPLRRTSTAPGPGRGPCTPAPGTSGRWRRSPRREHGRSLERPLGSPTRAV
jgi:hypothetical protein